MMKSKILFAAAACLAAPQAFSQAQPLVSKSNASGFVPAEYARFETCDVFLNQVVLTQRFGYDAEFGFTKREVRHIALDRSIQNVVAAAAKEELNKKDNFLCDAPTTTIRSIGVHEPTILFSSGGCGSPRLERTGPAALMLKELVNQYCPNTFDWGSQN